MRVGITAALVAFALATSAQARPSPERLAAVPYALEISGNGVEPKFDGDRLSLPAPKGSDLFSPAEGAPTLTAPRVTFTPKGDFIFSARVSRPLKGDYEGGALVLFGAEGDWAKLLFERIDAEANAVTSSVTRRISDNSYHQRLSPDAPAVWLKIVRQGGAGRFYMSEDGARWAILRDFPLDAAKSVAVGFASQSPTGEGFLAEFSQIRFEARTPTDYWQGN